MLCRRSPVVGACLRRLACPCAGPPPQAFLLRQVAGYVTRILSVFGIAGQDGLGMGHSGQGGGAAAAAGAGGQALLDAFSGFRNEVRGLAKAALKDEGGPGVQEALKQLLAESDRCEMVPVLYALM